MENKCADTIDVDRLLWNISACDDEAAFRSLFNAYYPALYVYAKRFVEEKETREDIVQDVFFSLWENRKRIRVQTSARLYLTACVRNHCLNFLRRQHPQSYDVAGGENIPVYAENGNDLYTLGELQTLLARALDKLPEAYRRVFELNRFEEKTYGEIADAMQLSVRTVERYKNKATEILKKELRDYLPFFIGWLF